MVSSYLIHINRVSDAKLTTAGRMKNAAPTFTVPIDTTPGDCRGVHKKFWHCYAWRYGKVSEKMAPPGEKSYLRDLLIVYIVEHVKRFDFSSPIEYSIVEFSSSKRSRDRSEIENLHFRVW